MRTVFYLFLLFWIGRFIWRLMSEPRYRPPEGDRGLRIRDRPTRESRARSEARAPPPDLDPGDFAPAGRDETMDRARRLRGVLTNPWSVRQDLIPPVEDELTEVVDAAMAGHGLLTPEELEEIHEIGREMDLLRPTRLHTAVAGEVAVRQSQEERAALKRQKKAQAEERRRQHEKDVADRRANDIVFLGRGVSRGLADRRANVERLEDAGLPLLATPADVAQALGLEIPRLRWLAFHHDAARLVHYVRFTVPKRSGGTRTLAAPHRTLATTQEWILRQMLDRVPLHGAAHGFVRGRSIATNARAHVGRDLVLNADLRDFFPTITFWRVEGVFRQLGYSPAAATVLGLLCTEAPRQTLTYRGETVHAATGPRALPQGACTSPALSNLVARRLDARLTGIARKLGWTYTRYADDLTFSTSGAPVDKVGYLLARVRHIAGDEGFAVNEKKTRVLRRNARQEVTGLVVNDHIAVPRRTVRRLRAILHRARTEGLASQNRHDHPRFEAWVRGMIAHISMAHPEQGARLRRALDAL